MSAAALAWLEAREPRPPDSLLVRLREALGSVPPHGITAKAQRAQRDAKGTAAQQASTASENEKEISFARSFASFAPLRLPEADDAWGVPLALAAAGLRMLERAAPRAGERSREAALDLLTADALLTYACEAAAEVGPEALDAVTRACGEALLQGGERA